MKKSTIEDWLNWLDIIHQGLIATEDPDKVRNAIHYCYAMKEDIESEKNMEGGEDQ